MAKLIGTLRRMPELNIKSCLLPLRQEAATNISDYSNHRVLVQWRPMTVTIGDPWTCVDCGGQA